MKKYFYLLHIVLLLILYNCQTVQAYTATREEYERAGKVTWEINTNKKVVALTFDDGPHPDYTNQILDILAKYNAKATFFVTGEKAALHPAILRRQTKEGHEIANHTFHHDYNGNTSKAVLKKELETTSDVINKITGHRPTLFRPVGGLYNNRIINTAIKNNYSVIMWSWHQDTKDWQMPGVNRIKNQVISGTKPGDIILFHDSGGDRNQTVKALEPILRYLNENGYKCVTVSEMLYRSTIVYPEFFHKFPVKH